MRPLDRVHSIKLKFGLVIVVGVGVSAVVSAVGVRAGIPVVLPPLLGGVIALVLVQVLARGMTSPLREMEAAASAMSQGDYQQRVAATSADEVGRLGAAFNAMAADLAEMDRVRRDLVANVSHELRTPITALRAVLENLVDGIEPTDPEVLRTMLRQVERLGRLVSQLLDLSRLESGAVPLHWQRFSVRSVLDDAVDEARLNAVGVELDVQVTPADLAIEADQERLHQVVTNLVHNAARHSPAGGRVTVTAVSSAGDGVRVEVCDQGPGISASEAQHVFDRFYRSDAARAEADGGAGLGLAIARWIVDLHGGAIRIEEVQPTGCRMVVDLPGRKEPAHAC